MGDSDKGSRDFEMSPERMLIGDIAKSSVKGLKNKTKSNASNTKSGVKRIRQIWNVLGKNTRSGGSEYVSLSMDRRKCSSVFEESKIFELSQQCLNPTQFRLQYKHNSNSQPNYSLFSSPKKNTTMRTSIMPGGSFSLMHSGSISLLPDNINLQNNHTNNISNILDSPAHKPITPSPSYIQLRQYVSLLDDQSLTEVLQIGMEQQHISKNILKDLKIALLTNQVLEQHHRQVSQQFLPFLSFRHVTLNIIEQFFLVGTGAHVMIQQNRGYFSAVLTCKDQYPSDYFDKIKQDVRRTGIEQLQITSEEKSSLLFKLENILSAYAIRNPYVQYCQGMNRIVFFILQNITNNEEEAYWILVQMLEQILSLEMFSNKDFFAYYLALIEQYILVDMPSVEAQLRETSTKLLVFPFSEILALFTNQMNTNIALLIWMNLIMFGQRVLVRSILAILRIYKTQILQTSTFGEMNEVLQSVRMLSDVQQFACEFNRIYINKRAYNMAVDQYSRQWREMSAAGNSKGFVFKKIDQPCNLNSPICLHISQMIRLFNTGFSYFIYKTKDKIQPSEVNYFSAHKNPGDFKRSCQKLNILQKDQHLARLVPTAQKAAEQAEFQKSLENSKLDDLLVGRYYHMCEIVEKRLQEKENKRQQLLKQQQQQELLLKQQQQQQLLMQHKQDISRIIKQIPGDSEDEDGNLTDMFSHRRKSFNLPDSPLSTPPKKTTNNNDNNFSKSTNLNIPQDSLTNSGSNQSNSNSINNNSNDTPNTNYNNTNNSNQVSPLRIKTTKSSLVDSQSQSSSNQESSPSKEICLSKESLMVPPRTSIYSPRDESSPFQASNKIMSSAPQIKTSMVKSPERVPPKHQEIDLTLSANASESTKSMATSLRYPPSSPNKPTDFSEIRPRAGTFKFSIFSGCHNEEHDSKCNNNRLKKLCCDAQDPVDSDNDNNPENNPEIFNSQQLQLQFASSTPAQQQTQSQGIDQRSQPGLLSSQTDQQQSQQPKDEQMLMSIQSQYEVDAMYEQRIAESQNRKRLRQVYIPSDKSESIVDFSDYSGQWQAKWSLSHQNISSQNNSNKSSQLSQGSFTPINLTNNNSYAPSPQLQVGQPPLMQQSQFKHEALEPQPKKQQKEQQQQQVEQRNLRDMSPCCINLTKKKGAAFSSFPRHGYSNNADADEEDLIMEKHESIEDNFGKLLWNNPLEISRDSIIVPHDEEEEEGDLEGNSEEQQQQAIARESVIKSHTEHGYVQFFEAAIRQMRLDGTHEEQDNQQNLNSHRHHHRHHSHHLN